MRPTNRFLAKLFVSATPSRLLLLVDLPTDKTRPTNDLIRPLVDHSLTTRRPLADCDQNKEDKISDENFVHFNSRDIDFNQSKVFPINRRIQMQLKEEKFGR